MISWTVILTQIAIVEVIRLDPGKLGHEFKEGGLNVENSLQEKEIHFNELKRKAMVFGCRHKLRSRENTKNSEIQLLFQNFRGVSLSVLCHTFCESKKFSWLFLSQSINYFPLNLCPHVEIFIQMLMLKRGKKKGSGITWQKREHW